MKRQTSLLIGSSTNFFSSMIIYAARFVTSVVVARTLGTDGKGVYTLALTVASLLALSTNLGLGGAFTYLAASRKFPLRDLFAFALLAAVGLSLAGGLIFYPLYKGWLSYRILAGINPQLILLVLFILPVNMFVSFINNLLLGSQRLIAYNTVEITRIFTNLGLQVLSSLNGLGIQGAIGAWSLSILIALGMALYLLAMETSFWPARPGYVIKPAFQYGVKNYLANLSTFFTYRLDTFLVNYYSGPSSLGLYSTAVGVAELFWFFPNSISTALFPKIPTLDRNTAGWLTAKTTRQALMISIPFAFLFGVSGVFLIPWIYSERFRPSIIPFIFLLPGILSMVVGKIISADLSGRGKPHYATYTSVTAVFLTLILDILLIPWMGIQGAAIASSIAYFTTSLMVLAWFIRETGVPWQQVLIPDRSDVLFVVLRSARMMDSILRKVRYRLFPDRNLVQSTADPTIRESTMPQQLRMVYTFSFDVESLPLTVPPGYHLVSYQPGIEFSWLKLLNRSGEFSKFSFETFWSEILSGLVPGGVIFVKHERKLVAAAAVCHKPDAVPNAVLMYVVVLREHRGKGLGTIVTQHAMEIARQSGYSGIVLNTDDTRLQAIRMYMRLGFQPDIETQGAQERWQQVLQHVQG